MRLLAAMSGGVDSSVAAAMALADGHEVVGVTLKQWEFADEETRLSKGCCTLDAVADARRVADVLGIPHYTFDFRDVFRREVVDPFVDEYASGRTPNPCIRCNQRVRFGALAEKAQRLGFDGLVTGHWARIDRGPDGTMRLLRARNPDKDQSYVLHALGRSALARAWFPLGELPSKEDVRERARDLGFPNAERRDSVEVCFVGEDRRPGDVVADAAPDAVRPGPIVDRSGSVVGEHRGLAYYTVGQRRGLGVALGRPGYVTTIDRGRNALVVGERSDLDSNALEASAPRFVSERAPADGARMSAVLRYRGTELPCVFRSRPGGFRLDFDRPARAVAPGQSVVLYSGDEVLGGGVVERAA